MSITRPNYEYNTLRGAPGPLQGPERRYLGRRARRPRPLVRCARTQHAQARDNTSQHMQSKTFSEVNNSSMHRARAPSFHVCARCGRGTRRRLSSSSSTISRTHLTCSPPRGPSLRQDLSESQGARLSHVSEVSRGKQRAAIVRHAVLAGAGSNLGVLSSAAKRFQHESATFPVASGPIPTGLTASGPIPTASTVTGLVTEKRSRCIFIRRCTASAACIF